MISSKNSNHYIHNLVSNYINPSANVLPRLKGKFESFSSSQQIPGNTFTENSSLAETAGSLNQPESKFKNDVSHFPESLNINPVYDEQHINGNNADDTNNKSNDFNAADQSNTNLSLNELFSSKQQRNQNNNSFLLKAVQVSVKENDSLNADTFAPDINTGLNFLHNNVAPKENNELKIVMKDVSGHHEFEQLNALDNNAIENSFLPQQNIRSDNRFQVNIPMINAFKQMHDSSDNASQQTTSVIKINIGRIDVRAVSQQTPVREPVHRKPAMSLNDFLNKKNGSK